MIFGALLALGGVLLLVYAKTSGANRIRAFSVEFELSTPALVVFLAGCALIVAPFLLPRASSDPGGDRGDGTGDTRAVGTGKVTCSGGESFTLEILKPSVADDVMRVPIRIRNVSKDQRVMVLGTDLTVSDEHGSQLDPLETEWSPPALLDPSSSYEGFVRLRIDAAKPSKRITARTVPNGSCPILAAVAKV